MKSHPNYGETLSGPALQRAAMALVLLLAAALLAPRALAQNLVVLDPQNPLANFTAETAKNPPNASLTPGPTLQINDPTSDDLITAYAATSFAAMSSSIDLIVTYKINPGEALVNGVYSGVLFTINDGAPTGAKAFYVASIVKNVRKGVAIASGTNFSQEGNYLESSFVEVDWSSPNTADGRVTLHLRRTADGTGQIIAVNGVAPGSPVELVRSAQPGPFRPRATPTVEFGGANLQAIASFELAEFRAFATPIPEPETYAMLLAGLAVLGFAARRRKLKEAAAA